jgi:hypothetical protein
VPSRAHDRRVLLGRGWAGLDLIDDRDGSVLFYDINGLSNFVARPIEVLGFDPHDDLVEWLKGIVAEETARAEKRAEKGMAA